VELDNRVASSDDEQLVLVDSDDREIGFLSKAEAHLGHGTLHRAFSLFVFNPAGGLLLQQRAKGKRLWPGYWSNTCCSHPRRGEKMHHAIRRRLREELGMTADLEFLFKFHTRRSTTRSAPSTSCAGSIPGAPVSARVQMSTRSRPGATSHRTNCKPRSRIRPRFSHPGSRSNGRALRVQRARLADLAIWSLGRAMRRRANQLRQGCPAKHIS